MAELDLPQVRGPDGKEALYVIAPKLHSLEYLEGKICTKMLVPWINLKGLIGLWPIRK